MRVTAVPAHSVPWMQPTTSARVGLSMSPARTAVIGRAPDGPPDSHSPLRVGADADVHVVVVVDQRLDLPPRPAKPDARPDEHLHGARPHEPSHEVLGEDTFDLSRSRGPQLLTVEPRIVDVHVEPVLVRGVTAAAEALVEDASVRP